MKSGMKSTIDATVCVAVALLIMTVGPVAMAQDPAGEEQQRDTCDGLGRLERKRCESGELTRTIGLPFEDASEGSMNGDERQSRRAEISEGLQYLKGVGSYLMRASKSDVLDLDALATATEQIRKHTSRLRSRLALPLSTPRAAIGELELPADRPQLRRSIHTLSSMIAEAVQNPLLKGQVLDVMGAAKARNDLDKIVELSERIRTQCELFGKTGP